MTPTTLSKAMMHGAARSLPPNPSSSHGPSAAALVALVLASVACSPESEAGGAPDSTAVALTTKAQREVERDIRDLVTAVTPLAPTVPVIQRNDWFARRKETLERLRALGPEYGREALRVYGERLDTIPEIRSGLLDVAAHAAPEEARPVLVDLVLSAEEDIAVRSKATELLGLTSPDAAIETIEPILRGDIRGRTFAAEETLLEAWNEACVRAGQERVPFLCEIAVDLRREANTRHLATRLLGGLPSEQGRQALEQLIVESSGNSYIRRLAAQSLVTTVPVDHLCTLLRRVLDMEVDPHFKLFLDNMMQMHCR